MSSIGSSIGLSNGISTLRGKIRVKTLIFTVFDGNGGMFARKVKFTVFATFTKQNSVPHPLWFFFFFGEEEKWRDLL